MTGTVLSGINNIYRVLASGTMYSCRIKGKVLKHLPDVYNPIAVGDLVEISVISEDEALITERLSRKNEFTRWNKKRNSFQTLAANIDLAVCVTSPESPPFRPRFIDRVIVNARDSYPVLVVLNKIDQGLPSDVAVRLKEYGKMGYEYLCCSALTGDGVDELSRKIRDKRSVFIGQSGVGKSSLINAIEPAASRIIGELSTKYNRGSHTTSFAVLVQLGGLEGNGQGFSGGAIVDTPGIREIEIGGMEAYEVSHFFPDFAPYASQCSYTPCLHMHEPDCGVIKALEDGLILPDRYESYLRILSDILAKQPAR